MENVTKLVRTGKGGDMRQLCGVDDVKGAELRNIGTASCCNKCHAKINTNELEPYQ